MNPQPMYSSSLHDHDSRYIESQPYPIYASRQSPMPPSDPQTSRRLPLPNAGNPQPSREGWGAHHYPHYVSGSATHSGVSSNNRQPMGYHGGYDYPSIHSTSYSAMVSNPSDPRHIGPLPSNHEDHTGSHMPLHGDWNGSMRIATHSIPPYSRSPDELSSARSSHPPTSPVDYPVIKKKRKRADAAQLKVLNDVYSRTAFPTTEERQELARKLDMTARSVQIWWAVLTKPEFNLTTSKVPKQTTSVPTKSHRY